MPVGSRLVGKSETVELFLVNHRQLLPGDPQQPFLNSKLNIRGPSLCQGVGIPEPFYEAVAFHIPFAPSVKVLD